MAWAASRMALPSRPELIAYTVGGDKIADPDGAWLKAYELEPDGAVLVRPDGYVAWASSDDRPDTEGLRDVLARWFGTDFRWHFVFEMRCANTQSRGETHRVSRAPKRDGASAITRHLSRDLPERPDAMSVAHALQ